ncbi:hypothetical protein D9M73_203020 [compost metagenome]
MEAGGDYHQGQGQAEPGDQLAASQAEGSRQVRLGTADAQVSTENEQVANVEQQDHRQHHRGRVDRRHGQADDADQQQGRNRRTALAGLAQPLREQAVAGHGEQLPGGGVHQGKEGSDQAEHRAAANHPGQP